MHGATIKIGKIKFTWGRRETKYRTNWFQKKWYDQWYL